MPMFRLAREANPLGERTKLRRYATPEALLPPPQASAVSYGAPVLEFFQIVAIVVYALCTLLTLIFAWFDRANTRLIPSNLAVLALGLFAPVPSVVKILMPFVAIGTLLAFGKRGERKSFDYQEHLVQLLEAGTITQAAYDEESRRIASR